MPHGTATPWTELTLEERRERRRLRREKQREDNIKRAAKMHAARVKAETKSPKNLSEPKPSIFVGCSGWRYWKWRDSFYANVPQNDWFEHYLKGFDTVEINASFYSWPTVAGVQAWRRQPGKKTSSIRSRSASSSPTSRIQGHEDSRQGFWHDLGYPRPPDGLFLVSVASDLSLYQSNVVEFRHA